MDLDLNKDRFIQLFNKHITREGSDKFSNGFATAIFLPRLRVPNSIMRLPADFATIR